MQYAILLYLTVLGIEPLNSRLEVNLPMNGPALEVLDLLVKRNIVAVKWRCLKENHRSVMQVLIFILLLLTTRIQALLKEVYQLYFLTNYIF